MSNQQSEPDATGAVKATATNARNWHSIVGPNGMCECGVRADGAVVNCADLLARRYSVEDIDEIVSGITAVVREADEGFQTTGGSSRHWARDWFLPLLYRHGWRLEREQVEGAADPRAELLAALRGVVRIADRQTPEFDAARAAIAKAEGK